MSNDVRVEVDLDSKKAEQDAEGLKGKLGKVFGDMGKIAGGIFMAEVGSQITSKGIDTLKSSIGLARDYNEILSKSNTIFGDQASAIETWASSASTSFGQSKAEALDAASSFGNMFTQLGMGGQTAADMSVKMTELASDFASFHNADITDVVNAQQAAFRGEYDALQKFVPTINAASVAQEAMAQTGKTSTAELTAGEKAAAAYSLMIKGAGDATGDFARTSDGLANQQRIMSAQWKDIQAQIGQALIPALTAVALAINTQVIPAVKDFGEKAKMYWEQNIKPAIDNMQAAWEKLSPVIVPILEMIADDIKHIGEILRDTVGLILALISGDWDKAWEDAKAIVEDFYNLFKDRIEHLKDLVSGAIPLLKEAAGNLMHGLWNAMSDVWSDIYGWFKTLPGQLLTALGDLSGLLVDVGKAIATSLLDGLVEGAKAVWNEVSGWGGKIKSLKGPIEKDRELLIEQGKAIAMSLQKGLGDGFEDVKAKVSKWATEIKTQTIQAAAETLAAMKDLAAMAGGTMMTDANGTPLSTAAGGSKTADQGEWMSSYIGGGRYENLNLNPNVGEKGPGGLTWNGTSWMQRGSEGYTGNLKPSSSGGAQIIQVVLDGKVLAEAMTNELARAM